MIFVCVRLVDFSLIINFKLVDFSLIKLVFYNFVELVDLVT